ncbi:probable GPI-anchored adhesin-like protein PGA55 [Pogonomyrmex barbatus]|uniref:Probable GPI-anchored adhesin-like protein PGA55 n=1 Tax=Pogonomyrmex barbatus TaxID=144034 RepID=A0A6I9VXW4_9HYME|nr:probable GPI-anchored adhesin-like protein PGA55 [Pogonomyrmex barbatus]
MMTKLLNAQTNNDNDSDMSPKAKHSLFMNITPPKGKFFIQQFKYPRVSSISILRKNRFLFKRPIRMNRSLSSDSINSDSWQKSPNSTLNHDSVDMQKSCRSLSRSAKIMKALHSPYNTFRRNTNIRKSLTFDSSPKESSYDDSSISSSVDTSSIINISSTESIANSDLVASTESIDENQNQTPQQDRKFSRISNKNDAERNIYKPRTSHLMSLLQEKTDNTSLQQTSDLNSLISSFEHDNNESHGSGLDIISTSTPKNAEQSYMKDCDEEQSSTSQIDISIENDNSHLERTMESSKVNMFSNASCTMASKDVSWKKNRNIKRMLIYDLDDKCSDAKLDHGVQQTIASQENNLSENGLDQIENDKQSIDFSDFHEHEESIQNEEREEKDCSEENACNEEVKQLSLQKESSNICNVSMTSENRIESPEANPIISQNTNKVSTPENNINMLQHISTESIKKSHKKVKHGNRKALFKMDLLHKIGSTKTETSVEDTCSNNQHKSQADICVSLQNSNRPCTPENVNSSRLLLLHYNSVKKSHKKDKRNKKDSDLAKRHNYEYHKRNDDSLKSMYEEENINKMLHLNELLGVGDSPDVLPRKKKRSVSISSQDDMFELPSSSNSLRCENTDNKFKIYTPIKKSSILLTSHMSADEMSYKNDESAQETSKEVDYSRCMTPITRFRKPSKSEDLTPRECDSIKTFETDESISNANLKDENGRSTPINMSTIELLRNKDSIKKSHKKDKHNRNKLILKKKRSYTTRNEQIDLLNDVKMLEDHTTLYSTHHGDNHCTEREMCSNMHEEEKDESYKKTAYDDPQPSTSRGRDIEGANDTAKSTLLSATPPNSLTAINSIKVMQTTSIKKSHKKERDINAHTKLILMSQECELSNDGSIFDEEDRLNYTDEITNIIE